jgi:hypothetical protein
VGLLLVFLFRSLVTAMYLLFLYPTLEAMVGPVFRHNSRYLPFSLLQQVQYGTDWGPNMPALLFAVYMVGLWLVAWYLFTRRDATSG